MLASLLAPQKGPQEQSKVLTTMWQIMGPFHVGPYIYIFNANNVYIYIYKYCSKNQAPHGHRGPQRERTRSSGASPTVAARPWAPHAAAAPVWQNSSPRPWRSSRRAASPRAWTLGVLIQKVGRGGRVFKSCFPFFEVGSLIEKSGPELGRGACMLGEAAQERNQPDPSCFYLVRQHRPRNPYK